MLQFCAPESLDSYVTELVFSISSFTEQNNWYVFLLISSIVLTFKNLKQNLN